MYVIIQRVTVASSGLAALLIPVWTPVWSPGSTQMKPVFLWLKAKIDWPSERYIVYGTLLYSIPSRTSHPQSTAGDH